MAEASHPAPFSGPVMDVLKDVIAEWPGPVLDPYAGIGRVHELGREDTWGIEIEPEWARAHSRTFDGDSSELEAVNEVTTNLFIPRPRAIVTSPDYGNRMADQYLGTPTERAVRAETGRLPRRRGYAISLGRRVSDGSGAGHHFGPKYRQIHLDVMTAVTKVCLPEAKLALNVSDSINAREVRGVFRWWLQMVAHLGWRIEDLIPVETRRFRDGSNSDLRVEQEWVIVATLDNQEEA